ncbi:MAG TPA: hypothetical protein VHN20_14320 [Beijerinckiaceae bacterium]|nr:hypothetical protein [Beijerinckiaceae bacterium]
MDPFDRDQRQLIRVERWGAPGGILAVTVTLAELCREAVNRYGDDWPRIERLIALRGDELPADERLRLDADVARILGFRAPAARAGALAEPAKPARN